MSDNNGFLSNYDKNMGDAGEPLSEVAVTDADLGYKYEQKSGFKKPENKGGGLPSFKRPKLLVPIIAGAAAVTGVIILIIVLLNGGAAVIDLTGKSLGDAQLWANQNGVMLTTDERFNDEYDAGTVIAQDKKPGETVKKGEFLSLTVSKGHDMSITLDVPDIMSMTADEVKEWVDANFMSKVIITTEFSDTVMSGKVIRYVINDNNVVDKIRRDTSIYVIVSKGPEDESSIQVTVPDFKTMSISESYIFANENGLTLTVEEQYDDYVPKGAVISQSVKAQEKVSRGSEIKLIISKGKMIEIPSFSGYTKEQAASVAADLGIPVTIIEKYSTSRSAGKLVKQSISAGTIYEEGDYLELTYSLGNKVMLASYIGQTEEAIRNWINDLNSKGASIKIEHVFTTYSGAPKGNIIAQDVLKSSIDSNTLISVNAKIDITVSLGKLIYVPDFVDHSTAADRGYDTAITREEAIEICNSLGLVPIFKEKAPDTTGRLPDEVWKQEPSAGKETSEGSTITLYYVKSVIETVPDLVNPSAPYDENSVKAVYNATFTLVFEDNDSPVAGYAEGEVVGQSIAAGSKVAKGSILILYLNPGP